MFAIIETGGKQHQVSAGDKIQIEKLSSPSKKPLGPAELEAVGNTVSFDKVLLVSDGKEKTTLGLPFVKGATVEGKVLRQARTRKMIVFRWHPKTHYHKKNTHRQPFTEIEITKISA